MKDTIHTHAVKVNQKKKMCIDVCQVGQIEHSSGPVLGRRP